MKLLLLLALAQTPAVEPWTGSLADPELPVALTTWFGA